MDRSTEVMTAALHNLRPPGHGGKQMSLAKEEERVCMALSLRT